MAMYFVANRVKALVVWLFYKDQIVFYYKNTALSKHGLWCNLQIDKFVTIDKNAI